MAGGEITAAVERFIHTHIDSVEQLEVLLLLQNEPGRDWSAGAVSQALYIQPESAAARLRGLTHSGLLSLHQEGEPLYRFAPRNQAMTEDARGLAEAYKVRRVAVINTIFARPLDSVRVFSDAFRIRRDE